MRRKLSPTVEPPSHYGHKRANDELNGKVAGNDVPSTSACGRHELLADQIGKDLANGTEADGAAVATDERSIVFPMITSMLEHCEAKAKMAILDSLRHRKRLPLPVGKQPSQRLKAAPLQLIFACEVSIES